MPKPVIVIFETPLFSLGTVVTTPGAVAAMTRAGQDPGELIRRHAKGDWGDICAEDKETNEYGVKNQGMIMSVYKLGTGEVVWIITAPGHGVSTLLTPAEY